MARTPVQSPAPRDDAQIEHGRSWQRLLARRMSPLLAYPLAVLMLSASLGLTWLIDWFDDAAQVHVLNLASAVLAAILLGRGPALLVAFGGALAVDAIFEEPAGAVFDSVAGFVRVVVYGSVAAITASLVGALRDALRFIDAQRQEAEGVARARRNVLGVVSHDLRNPLSVIRLQAEILERAVRAGGAPELVGASAAVIREGALSMQRIVQDLHDAVRVELGQFRVEPRETDVVALVALTLRPLMPQAEAGDIHLEQRVVGSPPRARCDRIDQVIANLVGNALKLTPPGGHVVVEVSQVGAEVQVAVADDGPGIAPEDLPNIFDRYWTRGQETDGGTGLGLFIARSIVASNGGSISVQSTPGVGTTFTIRLPVATSRP